MAGHMNARVQQEFGVPLLGGHCNACAAQLGCAPRVPFKWILRFRELREKMYDWWRLSRSDAYLGTLYSRRSFWHISIPCLALMQGLADSPDAQVAYWYLDIYQIICTVLATWLTQKETLLPDSILALSCVLYAFGGAYFVSLGYDMHTQVQNRPDCTVFFSWCLAELSLMNFLGLSTTVACLSGVMLSAIAVFMFPLYVASGIAFQSLLMGYIGFTIDNLMISAYETHTSNQRLLEHASDGFCSIHCETFCIADPDGKMKRLFGGTSVDGLRMGDFLCARDIQRFETCMHDAKRYKLYPILVTCVVQNGEHNTTTDVKIVPYCRSRRSVQVCCQVIGEVRVEPRGCEQISDRSPTKHVLRGNDSHHGQQFSVSTARNDFRLPSDFGITQPIESAGLGVKCASDDKVDSYAESSFSSIPNGHRLKMHYKLPSFSGARSIQSQSSLSSTRSFWDAMRLICGVDVAPHRAAQNVISNHIDGERQGKLWSDASFDIAKRMLLGDLPNRVDASRRRDRNRERAAASLAAAVIRKQGLDNMGVDRQVTDVISEFVDVGSQPPSSTVEGSLEDHQDIAWLEAFCRASGNLQDFPILRYQYVMQRLREVVPETEEDEEGDMDVDDFASQLDTDEEETERAAFLEDLLYSSMFGPSAQAGHAHSAIGIDVERQTTEMSEM